MNNKLKLFLVAMTSFYLIGCVSPLSVEESAPQVTINKVNGISIAVLDQRPYVLNKDKEPNFEGIIRSGFGIPYSYSTITGEPMSLYLGKRLEYGIEQKGVNVEQQQTDTATQFSDLMSKLKNDQQPSIVVVLNEWKYDFHALSDNSWYDVDITVADSTGKTVLTKNYKGEDDIPDGGVIGNEMMLIYKARFEKIFSDPELRQVIEQ
ncbi:hypothetical protein [Vibrio hippocampi]|uniref:Lipoprotein n=1 Tax=Vibrio hippocampi TaxID=654686 RepID=A0ABM8ZG57_9VIBR|nr:hypothetical protein [Vibrio hippocampi]CAH0524888.1 hypothetical protein VHP8226_00563 [Vibrio hippocampi]